MKQIHPNIAERLDALKRDGVIAGWKPPGGPNYGRGTTDLPAVLVPASYGPASTFYNEHELLNAVQALEKFGPMELFVAATRR